MYVNAFHQYKGTALTTVKATHNLSVSLLLALWSEKCEENNSEWRCTAIERACKSLDVILLLCKSGEGKHFVL